MSMMSPTPTSNIARPPMNTVHPIMQGEPRSLAPGGPNPSAVQAQPQPAAPNTAPQQQNPMQPFYMPNPTMGQATYGTAAQSNANVSPQAAIQQILTGFAPQAAQSTNALNNTLAAMGIVGGGATDAQTALQGQLAAALAPTLASSIQNSQGMGLQQALSNAGFQQQTGLANQQASNGMTSENLQNLISQQGYNTSAANQAQQNLAQALLGAWGQQFGAFNQTNLAGLGGTQSLLGQGLGNAGSLAGQEANNFPVYQSMWPQMMQLGAAYASGGGG